MNPEDPATEEPYACGDDNQFNPLVKRPNSRSPPPVALRHQLDADPPVAGGGPVKPVELPEPAKAKRAALPNKPKAALGDLKDEWNLVNDGKNTRDHKPAIHRHVWVSDGRDLVPVALKNPVTLSEGQEGGSMVRIVKIGTRRHFEYCHDFEPTTRTGKLPGHIEAHEKVMRTNKTGWLGHRLPNVIDVPPGTQVCFNGELVDCYFVVSHLGKTVLDNHTMAFHCLAVQEGTNHPVTVWSTEDGFSMLRILLTACYDLCDLAPDSDTFIDAFKMYQEAFTWCFPQELGSLLPLVLSEAKIRQHRTANTSEEPTITLCSDQPNKFHLAVSIYAEKVRTEKKAKSGNSRDYYSPLRRETGELFRFCKKHSLTFGSTTRFPYPEYIRQVYNVYKCFWDHCWVRVGTWDVWAMFAKSVIHVPSDHPPDVPLADPPGTPSGFKTVPKSPLRFDRLGFLDYLRKMSTFGNYRGNVDKVYSSDSDVALHQKAPDWDEMKEAMEEAMYCHPADALVSSARALDCECLLQPKARLVDRTASTLVVALEDIRDEEKGVFNDWEKWMSDQAHTVDIKESKMVRQPFESENCLFERTKLEALLSGLYKQLQKRPDEKSTVCLAAVRFEHHAARTLYIAANHSTPGLDLTVAGMQALLDNEPNDKKSAEGAIWEALNSDGRIDQVVNVTDHFSLTGKDTIHCEIKLALFLASIPTHMYAGRWQTQFRVFVQRACCYGCSMFFTKFLSQRDGGELFPRDSLPMASHRYFADDVRYNLAPLVATRELGSMQWASDAIAKLLLLVLMVKFKSQSYKQVQKEGNIEIREWSKSKDGNVVIGKVAIGEKTDDACLQFIYHAIVGPEPKKWNWQPSTDAQVKASARALVCLHHDKLRAIATIGFNKVAPGHELAGLRALTQNSECLPELDEGGNFGWIWTARNGKVQTLKVNSAQCRCCKANWVFKLSDWEDVQ